MTAESPSSAVQQTFRMVVSKFRTDAPVLILGHNDADDLSSMALLARALRRSVVRFRPGLWDEARIPGRRRCAPNCPILRSVA
jgi:single-stranded DNA-specific DHH superfamily exonuclease